MSTNLSSTKWISLFDYPTNNSLFTPSGMDKDNYIVFDRTFSKINSIYKYNIDNNKWIQMESFNSMTFGNTSSSRLSAALDVTKKLLYLFCPDILTQIQLNNNNITNHTHNIGMYTASTKSVIINNSLFIIGGNNNNSILKWNSENKTFT
eukprot:17009_1